MRKGRKFGCDEECERAFQELKCYLKTSPMLTTPEEGEMLNLYLAVSNIAVNSVLVKEDMGGPQRPIYYTSKGLTYVENLSKDGEASLRVDNDSQKIEVILFIPQDRGNHWPTIASHFAKARYFGNAS